MHTLKNLQQLRFYQIPKPKSLGEDQSTCGESSVTRSKKRVDFSVKTRHGTNLAVFDSAAKLYSLQPNQKKHTHKSHAFLKPFSWWYHIFLWIYMIYMCKKKWYKRMNIHVLECVVCTPLWVYRQVWLDHVFLCTFSRLEPMNNNQQDKSTACQAINYMGNSS